MSDTEREGILRRILPDSTDNDGKPPEQRTVAFYRSWPFIRIETVPETRRDHSLMFGVMLLATIIGLLSSDIPAVFPVATAFIAGYAHNNWVSFDLMYEEAE